MPNGLVLREAYCSSLLTPAHPAPTPCPFGTYYRSWCGGRIAPKIGIGGRLAVPPLPHHRAYGSRTPAVRTATAPKYKAASTTTSPVAIPTRAWSSSAQFSCGTRSTSANPHRVARSASSCAPADNRNKQDKPAKALDNLGDAAMVGAEDPAQILGIDPRGQRCRAHEIAEHHGQLAPLDLARHRVGRKWLCLNGVLVLAQRGDCVEQAAAMADRRDTQLAQVLSREPAQKLPINVVVAERGHISFEPEAAQPSDHIHGSCR